MDAGKRSIFLRILFCTVFVLTSGWLLAGCNETTTTVAPTKAKEFTRTPSPTLTATLTSTLTPSPTPSRTPTPTRNLGGVEGHVVSGPGGATPMPNLNVELLPTSGVIATTDGTGHYRMSGIEPADYYIYAHDAEHFSSFLAVSVVGGQVSRADISASWSVIYYIMPPVIWTQKTSINLRSSGRPAPQAFLWSADSNIVYIADNLGQIQMNYFQSSDAPVFAVYSDHWTMVTAQPKSTWTIDIDKTGSPPPLPDDAQFVKPEVQATRVLTLVRPPITIYNQSFRSITLAVSTISARTRTPTATPK